MKILVTGSKGLVGSRFVELYKNSYELLCPTMEQLDLTDEGKVIAYVTKNKPSVIVNFAAVTDVKAAQLENQNFLGKTWKTNYGIPYTLTQLCNAQGIRLIQISTDLIFSGKAKIEELYKENENLVLEDVRKISHYGASKLAAERYIQGNSKHYAIIRIAYPFRAKFTKTDFVRNFIDMYDSNTLYPLFNDNSITPTYIDEFCKVLDTTIQKSIVGVLHVCSINSTNHYEVAKYVLDKMGRDSSKLVSISMKDYLQKHPEIPRPLYTAMDSTKTQEITGISFKTWQQYIDEMLN